MVLTIYALTLLSLTFGLFFLVYFAVKNKWDFKRILLFFTGAIFMILLYINQINQNIIINSLSLDNTNIKLISDTGISNDTIEPINDTILYSYLKDIRANHAKIILAQAKLESSNYTSNLFKTNNNLFGMKDVNERTSVGLHGNENFSYYKNWKASVIDYILWQMKYAPNLDDDQYLKLCGKVYCPENPNYVSTIKKIASNLKFK